MGSEQPRSFEYLQRSDVAEPVLSDPQTGEPYEVPLSSAEEERAETLIADSPVVSFHDHPFLIPADIPADYDDYTASGWVHTAYEPLRESPLDAVLVSPLGVRNWDEAVHTWGKQFSDWDHYDEVTQCGSVEAIRTAIDEDVTAFVPCLETTDMIERDLGRLDTLYGLGIRSMNITYTYSNQAGTGYAKSREGGLTAFGHEVVDRMNDLGMLIDCSHTSDQTTLDVCAASSDPIVLSHNGARSVHDIDRLDSDEALRAVAETGGVVGIQAGPFYTVSPDHPTHSIESYMDHVEYVVDLVGVDHVAFGPDTLYGDHVSLQKHFGLDLSSFPDYVDPEIDHVRGMDNPTEAWTNIVRWLVKKNYSDSAIRKMIGGNVLRVLKSMESET